ncbi:hypothetical protein HZ994_17860 [Akkermansiaceae bacterium]|nr:hypothetical protein HZ994_17860 [Akkermansiaceae bacterium]
MKKDALRLGAMLAVLVANCMAGEVRDWTSKDGRTIRGELIGLNADGVKLKLAGGKVVDVPYGMLSAQDAAHAQEAGAEIIPDWNGWPKELRMNLSDVRITVDEERSKNGLTYYLTEHFELKSEVELGSQVRLDVGRIFELTHRLMQASPWGIMASPDGGRFKAELYKTRQSYVAAGAPTWSGGVYMGDRKVFMVPVESLGLTDSKSGYRRNEDFSLDTVVHEITHMLMADALQYLPIAVTEGIAEYISHIPLSLGAFKPPSVLGKIKDASKRRKPLAFETLLGMTASQWAGTKPVPRAPGGTGPSQQPVDPHSKSEQYHGSLLLAYHLMHGLDGGEPHRLRKLVYRAHAKAKKREAQFRQYDDDFAVYEKAIAEFMKLPGVKDMGEEGFTYPADLTPPEAPELPFGEETDEEMELWDMDVIFSGESPAAFAREMAEKLEAAGISLHAGL